MKHIVKCRYCHKEIDLNKESAVEEPKHYYYHPDCFKEFKEHCKPTEMRERIYNYLSHDLHVQYDYAKCEAQINKFVKQGCTEYGILMTLKYFYEVKNGSSDKSYGGIGIVPFVYQEAKEYWDRIEQQKQNLQVQLEQENIEEPVKKRKIKQRPRNIPQINLAESGE